MGEKALTATPAATKKTHTRKKSFQKILPYLMIFASVLVMLYPVLASQWNNYRQQDFANSYNRNVHKTASQALEAAYKEAVAYNQQLNAGQIRDPWDQTVQPDTPNYRKYLNLLTVQNPMAVVRIPKIDLSLPVYHGTSDAVLAQGLGHLYGTALPVGGKGTRTAITGHTGLSTATLFDRLIEVREGDVFYIDVLGKTLKYKVKQIDVVLPTQLDTLTPNPQRDLATLITCTPYGVNTHRLLVTGERVPLDSKADLPPEPPKIHFIWRPWMTFMVIVILVGLTSGFWLGALGKRKRRQRKKKPEKAEQTTEAVGDN